MFFKKISNHQSANISCLNETEIERIQRIARNSRASFAESIRLSVESMAGDLQSKMRGSGIDFEENKPYQPGSDSRHINWRTFARTQQLYTNIYNEDKRPSTYLVCDQRSTMYFGTRKQLKIKLALKFSAYTLLHAMYQQRTVSGVQLYNKPEWHSTYVNARSILSFLNSLNTPLINDYSNEHEDSSPCLNDILNRLNLNDGAELVIVSDLHDMNQQTISILYNLSHRYKVHIIQVSDPVEINLPAKGLFNIQNNRFSDPLVLDCNNKKITKAYSQEISRRFNHYKTQCLKMGVTFSQYNTLDNIFDD